MKLWRYDNLTVVLDMIQQISVSDEWDSQRYQVRVHYLGSEKPTVVASFPYSRTEQVCRDKAYEVPGFQDRLNGMDGRSVWGTWTADNESVKLMRELGRYDECQAIALASQDSAEAEAEAVRDQIEFLLAEVDVSHVDLPGLPHG